MNEQFESIPDVDVIPVHQGVENGVQVWNICLQPSFPVSDQNLVFSPRVISKTATECECPPERWFIAGLPHQWLGSVHRNHWLNPVVDYHLLVGYAFAYKVFTPRVTCTVEYNTSQWM